MIRIVVVDDQALVRAGFRMICEAEQDLAVVGEAQDGRAAVELCARLTPDIVLMDIRMPEMDGVEACSRITAVPAGPRVLMLTTFDFDDYVYAALRAGASGFLLKDTPPEQLIDAVRVVSSGDALLAPSVTRMLIEAFARTPGPTGATDGRGSGDRKVDALTERELDVLALMARGLSNAEIAESLYLGETTIKTHVGRVLMKLELRDRVQAVVFAYETGLIVPGAS